MSICIHFDFKIIGTSGTDSADGELGRDIILSIAIPVGSGLAVIIVLVFLILCTVKTIKKNKKQK